MLYRVENLIKNNEVRLKTNAPGKVLLLGGYAVLYKHIGLSIGVVDKYNKGVVCTVKENSDLKIISPQFGIDANPKKATLNSKNRLVMTAYKTAERYLESIGINVKNGVYTIKNSYIFGDDEEKSGLGSSAASTVALIEAVLRYNGIKDRNIIHKLSQISHAIATDKVGSGFDIATSVFGTIVYKRFSKDMLENATIKNIDVIVNKTWDYNIEKIYFPYNMYIFNVKGKRTSTTKEVMAANVLFNKSRETFLSLIEKQAITEKKALDAIKNRNDEKVREYINIAREIHREMSNEVKKYTNQFTPIEPKEFTQFIDKVLENELVIAGRCPGGGGYDSIVFLDKKNISKEEINKKVDSIYDIAKSYKLNLEFIETKIV